MLADSGMGAKRVSPESVERFIWTTHAEERRASRLLDRAALEQAIRHGHSERMINRGKADWRVDGLLADGRHFVVVYDHPNRVTARIVSVWDY